MHVWRAHLGTHMSCFRAGNLWDPYVCALQERQGHRDAECTGVLLDMAFFSEKEEASL